MSKNNQDNPYRQRKSSLETIGWREVITFPKLKITRVKAKIDTGARSSALHAFDLEDFSYDGRSMIRFKVQPLQRSNEVAISTEAELLEYREIKNSGGTVERRPVIKTEIMLNQQTWLIELTLTNREMMGFRMLLGREAIRNKFLVDPGQSYLQSNVKDHNNKESK